MSVSKYIKEQGLPSVVYVAEKANVNRQILYSWFHNNFALFEVVVAGCVVQKSDEVTNDYVKKKSGVHRLGDDDVF